MLQQIKRIKQITIASILSISLVLTTSGCGIVVEGTNPDGTNPNGTNLNGTTSESNTESTNKASAEIRPQDDYYGYINQATLANLSVKYGESAAGPAVEMNEQANRQLQELIFSIIGSDENYAPGSNEQLLRDTCLQIKSDSSKSMFESMAARVEEAPNCDTLLEVLTDFTKTTGKTYYLNTGIGRNFYDSDQNALYVEQKTDFGSLLMEDLYEDDSVRQTLSEFAFDTLTALQVDGQEAKRRARNLVLMMIEVAANTDYEVTHAASPFTTFTYYSDAQLSQLIPNIGIRNLQKICNIPENPYGGWYIQDPGQLGTLDALFCNEHLEELKTYLLCDMMVNYCDILLSDYPFLDIYTQGLSRTEEERTVTILSNLLSSRLSEEYTKRYYTEDEDAALQDMVAQIKDGYRSLFSSIEGLSEETKTSFLKKLDAIELISARSETHEVREEDRNLIGECLLDTACNIGAAEYANSLDSIGKSPNKDIYPTASFYVNAMYQTNNQIVVTPAIMQAPYFDLQADAATNLGGLGMVIAHELGHAFDGNCVMFDDNGNYRPDWIAAQDMEQINNRDERIAAYFDDFTILDVYHVDGTKTCGENIADLYAMKCLMKIVNDDTSREKLFRNYATIWCTYIEDSTAIEKLSSDEHSPENIRVNAVLSATKEFYDLYDLKNTDGMYREPEKWSNL